MLLRPHLGVLLAAALTMVVVPCVPEPAEAQGLVRPGKRRPGKGPGKRPGKRRPPGARPGAGGKARPVTRPGGGKAPGGGEKARNAALIQRYLGILESRPAEQFAMTRLVDLYRQEHGTLDTLVERFEQRVESESRAFAPPMILGELYNRAGRPEDAMRLFRQAAEARGSDPGPHLAVARVAAELGDGDTARSELEAALALTRGSDRQDVLRQLRDLVLEQGDLEGARRHHGALVRASSSSLYVRLELGQALARLERHREAVEELRAVLRHVRGDPRARVPVLREIARSQVALGLEDEALETLRAAVRQTRPGTGERAELNEMLVDVYRRRDDLRGLVEVLEGQRGGGFERSELLGRLCDELGEAQRAEEHYRAALRANQRHVDTRVRLIRLLTRQGRIEEATSEYESLVRLAPREPRFVTELAEMYLRVGQRQRALALLARVGRTNPSDVAIHSALLELYSHWGEEALALEEARALARIDPRDETHLVDLGERLHQGGDRDKALTIWRRIPSVAPDRWRGLASLADVYADHEMSDEAVGLYEEALRLRPDDIGILRRLANLLERLRRWDAAIERWERVIAVSGDQDTGARREARTRIVTIWNNQRSLDRRVPELRRRFAADPPDVEAGRFLYESLMRLGRAGEAAAVMRRVVELRPGDIETHLALERALVRQGDLAGAMEVLRQLLELAPRRSREFFQRLASYAMQLQRDDEALEFAARALALNPDDAQGHLRLAQLHRQQGNARRAVVEYTRAVELNDRLFDAYLELAELHETRSETREAVRVYVRLLGKSPDDALVVRAGRQALLLAVMDGTVAALEDDLLPLALAHTERAVYRRILVALYANLTWPLIQAAAYGEAESAARAREQLSAIGQRSLQPLLDALLDADPEQQEAAISMLGHLGNSSAAVPLLAYATGSEGPPPARVRAMVAAGQVGDERVVAELAEIVGTHTDQGLRAAAAFGLGRIATAPALAALRRHLEGPTVPLRALACVGLGRSDNAADVDRLVRRLEEDQSPLVRAAAAWALGRVGTDRATEPLVRVMRSAPALVRRAALWALGATGDGRASGDLAWALFDQDDEIRSVAAWALRRADAGPLAVVGDDAYHRMPGGQLRVPAYVEDLVRHSPADGSARAALAHAGDDVVAALELALGGRGRPRTERVVVALRALEARRSGRLYLSPLVLPEELEDDGVEAALAPIRRAAVRRAAELLRHRSPQVRGLAIAALGRAGGEGAVTALSGALGDEDRVVRQLALEHLGRLEEPGVVTAVAGVLDGADPSLRARAVRVLGLLGGDEAIARLLEVLRSDGSPEIRVTALRALSPHAEDDEDVRAALIAAARGEDALTAAAACTELRGSPALPPSALDPCR